MNNHSITELAITMCQTYTYVFLERERERERERELIFKVITYINN
jgi:hypothetical protein